jgi:NitT/TauT family transport system permease protein
VFESLAKNFPTLVSQTWWTAGTVLTGFLVAAAFAIPVATLIVVSPVLERLLYPPMVATQSIPKIALAPLFIVWFGFGVVPKVAVAFLIAFFPIVIDTIVGLRSIDPAMIQLARSMGAPPHRMFLKLRLPHALPMIFGGLKVASSLAVVGALTGEFVGSDKGLGYLLLQASGNLNTALLFATLVVLSALAMAFFYLVEVLERILIPWHASQRMHPH